MAKTRGPLFSIGASGSIGRVLTFNPTNTVTTARKKPHRYPAPSGPQIQHRQKCRDAATAWHALTEIERADWSTLAQQHGQLPFAKYLLEWIAQQSTPSQPPFIPMA